MSEFDVVDMKGRELQVCTFYQPPFSYLNKTIKKVIDGVEEEVFLADNGELFENYLNLKLILSALIIATIFEIIVLHVYIYIYIIIR